MRREDPQNHFGNRVLSSRTVLPSLTPLIVQFLNFLRKSDPILHLTWGPIRSQLMWEMVFLVARCTHLHPWNSRISAVVLKERIRCTPNPLIYLQTTPTKSLASLQSSIKGKILETSNQLIWAQVWKASSIFEWLRPNRFTTASKRPSHLLIWKCLLKGLQKAPIGCSWTKILLRKRMCKVKRKESGRVSGDVWSTRIRSPRTLQDCSSTLTCLLCPMTTI